MLPARRRPPLSLKTAQPLEKTVTRSESHFRLAIAVRADSPYRSVRELVGRRCAFGDPHAILQRAIVMDAGIRLEGFRVLDPNYSGFAPVHDSGYNIVRQLVHPFKSRHMP